MLKTPAGLQKVSSCFAGIDVDERREYLLDLCLPTVRDYVKAQGLSKLHYVEDLSLWACEATWKALDGISTACGDMTNYCFDYYVRN